MLFRRRPVPIEVAAREWIAPRRGWGRKLRYLRTRLQRLPGSPETIATGFACGVGLSFTPLFGAHILVAVGLAWALGASRIAAAIGTAVGNPITFPAIAGAAIGVGQQINQWLPFTGEGSWWTDFAWPYATGGVTLGALGGLAAYMVAHGTIRAYQSNRAKRRRKRRSPVWVAQSGAATKAAE